MATRRRLARLESSISYCGWHRRAALAEIRRLRFAAELLEAALAWQLVTIARAWSPAGNPGATSW